jgi:hypothetical protein
MPKLYLRLPPDEALETSAGWEKIGTNTFAAVQADLVIVQKREKVCKGPPIKTIDIPGGAEYSVQDKKATVTKHSSEIQKSIQQTIISKLAAEAVAKIATEIGTSGIVVPTAKISSELQSKVSTEFTDQVQSALTQKVSFEVQDTHEITRSVSYKPSTDGKPRSAIRLQFYLNLWPWRWDFYLYRIRYLILSYEQNWLSPNVRKAILQDSFEPKHPLFSLRVYEPQDEYSWTEHEYAPDVADEALEEIKQEPLATPMPDLRFPAGPTLEDLARLAFPVTKQERKLSPTRRRAAPKRSRRKKSAKRHMRKKRM